MKRLLLSITVVALMAALMAPAAQAAQGYWYWCWNDSSSSWDYCWWEGDVVVQNPHQVIVAGDSSQTFDIT